ncbi:16S rRNA (uracil1498-N3)-methyltransferase [Tangfeifania diversioriginum]|uniref:Ribosomal RNA small subunit methyltransferase E n=1 Tax=Tangfeifania diversioriginum TaxID=1168035 RepID=A0A1M6CTH2_9BACT|nr:16S rRNA (uracil(1498)-N(3))-methyltransferase [Tangfeifania diversioriginum]SHI64038.1 16S rRNA (uracil1498-N3)-methyltransferase [Tangfeifania diversioriginum]
MQLFYISDISGDSVTLGETESKHAVKVLRMREGDRLELIDGKGGFYEAEISNPHPKKCVLSILKTQKLARRKNYRLHIAIAPTKNIARFEWFLEKATEIGIDEITPLLSAHSERKAVKFNRLEKILVSAMKQSQKAFLPKLNDMVPFNEIIKNCTENEKFIAHCYKDKKPHLKNLLEKENDILIMIGPEGDFSEEEVATAKENGFSEISLGDERLRTETAGIVACHTVNLVLE